ncbi:hypothetical protein vseg_002698 [Gypsophila vaccaria]
MSNQSADQTEKQQHHHYTHCHPSKYSRWTARECYEYMYAKPWAAVNDFYSDLVNGRSSLSDLFGAKPEGDTAESPDEYAHDFSLPEEQLGRWARVTYKMILSYHGAYFDGWQKQPGLNTVQRVIERSVGTFVDDKKAQQLKAKGLPVDGMVVVAGRTDKGVTGLHQVCSFYTWKKDVNIEDIEHAINAATPGKLRVISVSQVSRAFHPNFCAKWRRYLYIFPLSEGVGGEQSNARETENLCSGKIPVWHKSETTEDSEEERAEGSPSDIDSDGTEKPMSFSIAKVDRLLRHLEGKLLSYRMFARDTKASRNVGPPTECYVYHARATEARLPCSNKDHADGVKTMCVELVANRFLRRMIRVLVATVVREAAAGSEDDALLKLTEATCRRATAPPAPPDGLCFVDVGYSDFDPQICFIP